MPAWAIGVICIVSFWLFCATMKVLVQSISYTEKSQKRKTRKSLKKAKRRKMNIIQGGNRTRSYIEAAWEEINK